MGCQPLAQLSTGCAASADHAPLQDVCEHRNPARVGVGIAWARLIERPFASESVLTTMPMRRPLESNTGPPDSPFLRAHLQDQGIRIAKLSIGDCPAEM